MEREITKNQEMQSKIYCLAEQADVNVHHVFLIADISEEGQEAFEKADQIPMEDIEKIANFFNVPVSYLFED